ncbi:hypothetical protein LM594_01230 [Candidatus Caldipriscus sp.]|nr:hypothetical protein [Candidatus Caldipriscus sp.]
MGRLPKYGTINWIFWGLSTLCILGGFYLTLQGEKVLSTVLFILGYLVFPIPAILITKR